jgi:hypothetical protein
LNGADEIADKVADLVLRQVAGHIGLADDADQIMVQSMTGRRTPYWFLVRSVSSTKSSVPMVTGLPSASSATLVAGGLDPRFVEHSGDGAERSGLPRIRQRPSQPVQLGHHQGVAGSPAGQRQSQAWSVPVPAGQAIVDLDAIVTDTERVQAVALGREILLLC